MPSARSRAQSLPFRHQLGEMPCAHRAPLWCSAWVVQARPVSLSFLRLQPDLDKPAEGNFSSDCGVVLASYPRVNGVQVCFSPVNPGGHLSSLVSFLSFCIRGVTRRFELAHFDFTFSPSSTKRRMASEIFGRSGCWRRQSSIFRSHVIGAIILMRLVSASGSSFAGIESFIAP